MKLGRPARSRRSCAALLLSTLCAMGAPACVWADSLFGVDELLKKIDHLGVYWMGQSLANRMELVPRSKSAPDLQETGIELFVNLLKPAKPAEPEKTPPKHSFALKGLLHHSGGAADSVELVAEASTEAVAAKAKTSSPCDSGGKGLVTQVEVGISYGALSGFAARDSSAGGGRAQLDLRGVVKAGPVVTAYVTFSNDVYLGVGVGRLDLDGVRIYDFANRPYEVSGTGWQFAVALGQAFELGKSDVLFFVEPIYNIRNIRSLKYTPLLNASDFTSIPAGWPRDLDLSGFGVSVGLQAPLNFGK